MTKYLVKIRRAIFQALAHDAVNTSKAAAYSGVLMLFPALLVVTTLVAQVHEGATALGELRAQFEQFVPPDTLDLLQSSFLNRPLRSVQLIVSAFSLGVFAGMGLMLSLMEGFRRAYRLPAEDWGFWNRRVRAMLLLPIVLAPLSAATIVIVFGRGIESWMTANFLHERYIVLFFWRMVRWSISLVTGTAVLSCLYHFGTRRREHWGWVLPGAIAGTLIWFPATLAFGWYVTLIGNYSRFYGPFGAAIATLVWLYISSFSVLLGAELNGILYWERREQHIAERVKATSLASS